MFVKRPSLLAIGWIATTVYIGMMELILTFKGHIKNINLVFLI